MDHKNSTKDKKCPLCNELIRSDASVHDYCKLCGMGIPEPFKAPKLQTNKGLALFCCTKCYHIYLENVYNKTRISSGKNS